MLMASAAAVAALPPFFLPTPSLARARPVLISSSVSSPYRLATVSRYLSRSAVAWASAGGGRRVVGDEGKEREIERGKRAG